MRMESVQRCCLFWATPTVRHDAIPSGHEVYSFPGRRSPARDLYFRVWYLTVHISKKTEQNTAKSQGYAAKQSYLLNKAELTRLKSKGFRSWLRLYFFFLRSCTGKINKCYQKSRKIMCKSRKYIWKKKPSFSFSEFLEQLLYFNKYDFYV